MSRSVKILFGLLLVAVVLLGWRYFQIKQELGVSQTASRQTEFNVKVLNFTQLFIAKILRAQGEVDFETRLQLENAVRELNDEEVLLAWQRFTGANTEAQAQEELKNLLELLVSKIRTA